MITQSTIVRVRRGGAIELVADASDGLDWASSLAFALTKATPRLLYTVNFAIGPQFGAPPGSGPALLKIALGGARKRCHTRQRAAGGLRTALAPE